MAAKYEIEMKVNLKDAHGVLGVDQVVLFASDDLSLAALEALGFIAQGYKQWTNGWYVPNGTYRIIVRCQSGTYVSEWYKIVFHRVTGGGAEEGGQRLFTSETWGWTMEAKAAFKRKEVIDLIEESRRANLWVSPKERALYEYYIAH